MNWKMWVPLALAMVFGLVAAIMAREVLSRSRPPAPGPKLAHVVVARHAVQPGQTLHADDLTLGDFVQRSVPEGAFTDAEPLDGRVVIVPLSKGQPVSETLLAPRGAGAGLQALVPTGMRAITISVDEFSGVAGLLLPGCRVDVLSTFQNENTGGHVARTIVQNVKVQAVGQRISSAEAPPAGKDASGGEAPPPGPSRSVTLLATPEEAEAIELAAATGRPRLVLRSSSDNDTSKRDGVSALDLAGKRDAAVVVNPGTDPFANPDMPTKTPIAATEPTTQPAVADVPPPPAFETRTVTAIRGGQESTVTFQLPLPPAGSSGVAGADPKPVEGSR